MTATQYYGTYSNGNRYLRTDESINSYLMERDKRFSNIIDICGNIEVRLSDDPFSSLVDMIINQQTSNNAAMIIRSRFNEICGGSVEPSTVLSLRDGEMRSAGISCRKIECITCMASSFHRNSVNIEKLQSMTDENIIAMLTSIKGVGKWTAEMFLIFVLGREDVFSMGDAGLRRAAGRLFGASSQDEIGSLSAEWSPYRSYASLYLWDMIDKVKI